MKFINLLSVFTLIISQNILIASSAYAAIANNSLTLVDKTTSCATICGTITGAPEAGNNSISIAISATGLTPGIANPKTFIFKHSADGTDLATVKSFCTSNCESYRSDAGLTLGNLDAVSNLSSNTLSKAVCNAFRIVTGGAGKTFASFAVIATGIGFFTGKVSWGLMIGVAAGIATMFGASSIVAAISGESVNTMCDINFKN